MGKEWRFTQLGGPRRVLTLTGACAPHGRPRQRAVVSDGIKLRKSRIHYPDGGNRPPTTHIFGTEWHDWVLEGRFSDRELGPLGTQKAIHDWQQFVIDAQSVEVLWGDLVHADVVVDEFLPGREAEDECSYKITLLIDKRTSVVSDFVEFDTPRAPTVLCQALQAELDANVLNPPSLPNAGDLKPDFLDTLEEFVSNVNGFSASLISIAGDIDAFAEATTDQLERLRAGLVQTRTAVHRLRTTYETTANEVALLAPSASDTNVLFVATRTSADVSTLRMLAILDELDRQAELVQRGRLLSIYTARLGDTWESIASAFFGGPSEAGRIRDANGVLYGALPTPGRDYQIPVGA